MATVAFTDHLRDHAPDEPIEVAGATVAEALAAALEGHDRLRSYVFDEQGRLRRHVAVFIDGKLIADRVKLSDPITPAAELFVMQALSGG
jgi:molybdopterin synthase sulfur carrier subunit